MSQDDGFDKWWGSVRPFPESTTDGDLARAAWSAAKLSALPVAEPAVDAWNRAFRYVSRYGWDSSLDSIPEYELPAQKMTTRKGI
jgi:hypothetical protein